MVVAIITSGDKIASAVLKLFVREHMSPHAASKWLR